MADIRKAGVFKTFKPEGAVGSIEEGFREARGSPKQRYPAIELRKVAPQNGTLIGE